MPDITRENLIARKSALEQQHRDVMFQAGQIVGAIAVVNDMLAQCDAPDDSKLPTAEDVRGILKPAAEDKDGFAEYDRITGIKRPAPGDYSADDKAA